MELSVKRVKGKNHVWQSPKYISETSRGLLGFLLFLFYSCNSMVYSMINVKTHNNTQEQLCRGVFIKRYSGNKNQSYRRIPNLCKATLLKSHFGMVVLLQSCYIFPELHFLITPLVDYFWTQLRKRVSRVRKMSKTELSHLARYQYYLILILSRFNK